MRLDRFTLATFVVKASESNSEAPDGVLDVSISLSSEQALGTGFGSISRIDGDGGGGTYDTNHCTIYRTEHVNYDLGKISFKGSLSASPENSALTYGHGILVTETK